MPAQEGRGRGSQVTAWGWHGYETKEIQGKLKKRFLESLGEKDLARQGLELGQMDSDLTHVFVPNITGLCLYSMSLSFPTDSSAPLPVLLLRKDGRLARQMRTSLLHNYSRGMAMAARLAQWLQSVD